MRIQQFRQHSNAIQHHFISYFYVIKLRTSRKKNLHWKYFIDKWNREINASNKCWNRVVLYNREKERDRFKKTRREKNFLTKKKKETLLRNLLDSIYQNRANIPLRGEHMVERELPIDLRRRSFAFDRHPFTSLCKMFRATSTLNDKRCSKFSPFSFFFFCRMQRYFITKVEISRFDEEDLRYSFR